MSLLSGIHLPLLTFLQLSSLMFVFQVSADVYADVNPLLRNELFLPKGAGVRARVTTKGLRQIVDKIAQAIGKQILESTESNPTQSIPVWNPYLMLERPKIVSYRWPLSFDVTAEQPTQILLELKSLGITMIGRLQGYYSNGNYDEAVSLQSDNAQLSFTTSVQKTRNGVVNLVPQDCHLFGRTSVNLTFETLKNKNSLIFQGLLVREGYRILESLMCTRTKSIITERINMQLNQIPPQVPLSDANLFIGMFRSKRRSNRNSSFGIASLIERFNVSKLANLFLDYSMTEDPVIRNNNLEAVCSGEISIRGLGGTPFGPPFVALPALENSPSMFHLLLTDFIPNSLMYHSHKSGLFNARVDPATPQIGSMMQATCGIKSGPLFCLGDILPTLKHYFPDRGIAMVFSTKQPPVLIFQAGTKGSFFGINGHIAVWAIDEYGVEKKVGEMDIDIEALFKIYVVNSVMRSKITLEKIQFISLTPALLRQEELDDASFLCREVMQRMVNDILKDGIPIPIHPLFKLYNLKVSPMNRAYVISTDFELNGNLVKQLTTARDAVARTHR